MTAAQDPRDPGRHLLGPHVVGQRVVIRRLLRGETGPSGGPAMTDLLGTCVAWGEGVCVVQPEAGAPVEIAIADIVSGKPVPPRPSMRMRVTPREAELHTTSLWSTIETTPLGEWVMRTDTAPVGRLRRRGNSCLAMGDPGRPFTDAVAAVREFYEVRGRPPYAQVEAGSPEEDAFLAAGWRLESSGEAEHRLGSLSLVRRRLRTVPVVVDLATDPPAPSAGSSLRAVATVTDPSRSATSRGSGVGTWARGEAAIDLSTGAGGAGDWIGVHAIEVDPAHRRQGLATAVLAELLDWGAEQGATTVWLHVETDNAPARAWYDSLGLAPHHTCRYLTPPG